MGVTRAHREAQRKLPLSRLFLKPASVGLSCLEKSLSVALHRMASRLSSQQLQSFQNLLNKGCFGCSLLLLPKGNFLPNPAEKEETFKCTPSSISLFPAPRPHATLQPSRPSPVFCPLKASRESSPRDLLLRLDQPCVLTPTAGTGARVCGSPATPGTPRGHESVASCSQQVTRMVAHDNKHGLCAISRHTGEENVSDRSEEWTIPKLLVDQIRERWGIDH